MNDLLERAVKSALDDLVATTPPTPDVPIRSSDASPPTSRAWLAVAAALIIGIGAVGLWAAARPDANEIVPTDVPEPIRTDADFTGEPGDSYPWSYDPTDNGGFVTYHGTGPVEGTDDPGYLPEWPEVATSEAPATNRGYGLAMCTSDVWERAASLDVADAPVHSFTGTLCPRITLAEAVGDSIASCSNLRPDWIEYARCQRLPDEPIPDVDHAVDNTAMTTVVDVDAYDTVPPPARHFQGALSATGSTVTTAGISVSLTGSNEEWERCYVIELPEATARGCLDEWVFLDGLAYGAFRAGDGPIEIVGIVPDDVATVEIGGTTIQVENNVWHYTDLTAARPSFTVYSADRTRSASIGEAVSAG